MSLDTSRKILKVIGILSIIFGIIALLSSGLLLFGGKLAQTAVDTPITPEQARLVTIVGIAGVVLALITFFEGIFSVRASKDFSKIMPAWVFAILSLVGNVVDGAYSIVKGGVSGNNIFSIALSIALAILVFAAANNIKKSVGK